MKKFKTSEAIAMLEINPKLRFEAEDRENKIKYQIYVDKGVNIHLVDQFGNDSYGFCTTDTWTLVQQPVTFIEAVKAYADGKTIKCKHEDRPFATFTPGKHLRTLKCNEDGEPITSHEILEAKWYIEE